LEKENSIILYGPKAVKIGPKAIKINTTPLFLIKNRGVVK
jgi:hypothetical protein